MTIFEFNEIMDAVKKDENLLDDKGNIFYLKDIRVEFSLTYYAIVRGKIPYEVAKNIYGLYPKNEFKIRVSGGRDDWNFFDFLTDDEYERAKNENLGNSKLLEEARNMMVRRNDKNKYIPLYHIDTKEGLLVFLSELRNYYLGSNNLEEDYEWKSNIMSNSYFNMIKNANLKFSTYDIMKSNKSFNETVDKNLETDLGSVFRSTLDEFDRMVNPFMDEGAELDDDYLDKVDIDINARYYKKSELNGCELTIHDKDTGNEVFYSRKLNGFCYKVCFKADNNTEIIFAHCFVDESNDSYENGEFIYVICHNDDGKKNFEFRFNITEGLFGETYPPKDEVKLNDFMYIYGELKEAINYAHDVTVKILKTNEETKKKIISAN